MAIFYTHPRVDINKTAITRQRLVESEPDSLRLFAPFKASFGPTNEISILHDISDFTQPYGEFNFDQQGQTALNIRNWLLQGGTVYGMRVDDGLGLSAKNSIFSETFDADFGIYDNAVADSTKYIVVNTKSLFYENIAKSINSDYDNYAAAIMLFTVDPKKNKIKKMEHVGYYKFVIDDDGINIFSDIDIKDLNLGDPANSTTVTWAPAYSGTLIDGYEYYLYNPVLNTSFKIDSLENISTQIINCASLTNT